MTPASVPVLASVNNALTYLTSTPLHPSLPWTLFGVIHATRIATAYRGAAVAGGYEHRLSLLQAAAAPCILILGGTTITGILLGIVPGWLISPVPILTYGVIPVLVSKTGITRLLLKVPQVPRDLLFSCVDGCSRITGITTFGVDTVLTHPNLALRNSPWAMIAVATLAGGGGGLIVPSIKAFHADWSFATPPWLKDGPGIDIWGATFIAFVYATLIDAHPFFRRPFAFLVANLPGLDAMYKLPKGYLTAPGSHALLQPQEAKIFCSLLLAAMLCTKVLLPTIRSTLSSPRKSRKALASNKPSGTTSKSPVATPKVGTASTPKGKSSEKKNQ